MKDRTITYRGVTLKVSGYRYEYRGTLYDFEDVCDLIDSDLLSAGVDLFENTEHLSRSERVRRDLVGKNIVVGFSDGRTETGTLDTVSKDFVLDQGRAGELIVSEDIDNCEAVVKGWSVLTMDQKSLFVDLHTWGGALREAKAEVVRCENKVESLFNQIKNI